MYWKWWKIVITRMCWDDLWLPILFFCHRPSSFFIVNHLKWRVKTYKPHVIPEKFPIRSSALDRRHWMVFCWFYCCFYHYMFFSSHLHKPIIRQEWSSIIFIIKPWTLCPCNQQIWDTNPVCSVLIYNKSKWFHSNTQTNCKYLIITCALETWYCGQSDL